MATLRGCLLAPLAVVALCGSTPALAQPRFLLADRTNDVLWVARDADNNGVVAAAEIAAWFDATNAAGTPGNLTMAALAVRRDGLVVATDSDAARRGVYLYRDRNDDGNAQGAGESAIVAGPGNESLVGFGAPLGAAFDSRGYLYISNASNVNGLDAIYRLIDLNLDGDFNDAGEITEYVGAPAFGSSTGSAFNPGEIVFIGDVGFMRNSSGTQDNGVHRFVDLNGNGRADDPGEFTPFWVNNDSNASGVLPGPNLSLAVDTFRPGALYTLQVTGGADLLIRIHDLDGDGIAHQPGEARIVYANAATGFTAVNVLSLPDGRVLLTDSAGVRVLMLTDLDGDGAFTSEGEAVEIISSIPALGTVRHIALLPCPGDWDNNLVVNSTDISGFITAWLDSVTGGGINADWNFDGVVNSADISAFITSWLTGVQGGC